MPTDTLIAVCLTCNGPIYSGEPVSLSGDAISHRFKTWCEHYQRQEAAFVKAIGITLGDPSNA